MENLSLGKIVEYPENYSSDILQAVPRSIGRNNIELTGELPFHGVDIWNAYEVSWLNPKGKPIVAILRCDVPITSPNLIESKSFKLYLNSLNQTVFASKLVVENTLKTDLSACAGSQVNVELYSSSEFSQMNIGSLDGYVIDDIDVNISTGDITPSLLCTNTNDSDETLVSHLLKSNCLITNQPDWGSVIIRYVGKQIDRAGLLKYLISFRQHNEFHEQCVERIFKDIMQQCSPTKLTVYARYTRRGGIDINPFRSNFEATYPNIRLARQ